MVEIVMEGLTPPQQPNPFQYKGRFPWRNLKAGESFLVITKGLSEHQYRRKVASLRSNASIQGKELGCRFDVFRLTPPEGIRVRREG